MWVEVGFQSLRTPTEDIHEEDGKHAEIASLGKHTNGLEI